MGGPQCDHSPSSLICSHYPYQHLKIKNKDSKSDGGGGGWGGGGGTERGKRQRQRKRSGGLSEGKGWTCVYLSQQLPFAPILWMSGVLMAAMFGSGWG